MYKYFSLFIFYFLLLIESTNSSGFSSINYIHEFNSNSIFKQKATRFEENFNSCATGSIGNGWKQYSKTGNEIWDCSVAGGISGTNAALMNGYNVQSNANEDWLISPAINLSQFAKPALTFWSRTKYAGNAIKIRVSSNYPGTGDPSSYTWTDLSASLPASNSDIWNQSNAIDLSAYKNTTCYIAFYYTSTTTSSARWTLDDVVIDEIQPKITINPKPYLDLGNIAFPGETVSSSYKITVDAAAGDLTISAPLHFLVSKDNISFASQLVFSQAELTQTKTVYVKFKPTSAIYQTFFSEISNTCGGLSVGLTVAGSEGNFSNKNNTFDVVTFNCEWFGDNTQSPDDATQIANLINLIKTLDADVYALQEITDINGNNDFQTVLTALGSGYSGVRVKTNATPDNIQQSRAFIYKNSVLTNVATQLLMTNEESSWPGKRVPVMLSANVTINGVTKPVKIINLHMKAFADATSYAQRVTNAASFKTFLDNSMAQDNFIVMGDHNDDFDVSIYNSSVSPYQPMVDDFVHYRTISKYLTDKGISTTYGFSDPIDHIWVSDEMSNFYISGTVYRPDLTSFITSPSSTLSDHYPVMARFDFFPHTATTLPTATQASGILPTEFKANWLPFSNASHYLLDVSTDNFVTFLTGFHDKVVTSTSELITGLVAGTTCKYRIRAVVNSVPTDYSNVVTVNTLQKLSQTINFLTLPLKMYGQADFLAGATASSNLPVTYTSSNVNVATVIDGKISILAAGTTIIKASQAGNNQYFAATDVSQTLTVAKANQTISFSPFVIKILGEADFDVSATATSGLQVSFSSANTSVATIVNGKIHIVNVGSTEITALQAGNTNYSAAPDVKQTLLVYGLTGINDEKITQSMVVPNPNKGDFSLNLPIDFTGYFYVEMYNLAGELVNFSFLKKENSIIFQTQGLHGIYLLHVKSDSKILISKVIIE